MNIRQIAADISAERGFKPALDGIIEDEQSILWPGSDFQNGTLYMTFPAIREVAVTNRKGEIIGTERKMATYAVTSEGEEFWYDPETVLAKGYVFPQTFTQELENRWSRAAISEFTRGEAPNIDPGELFSEIRQEIFDHVEYGDDIYYDVIAYYILISYVFRAFGSISYIHFNGTMASGKSQNLRMLSLLAFNAVWASNMSAASLYRQVAGCPGMLCIDEAESFDGERGEEIRRLLNAGYTAPGYVPRAEKEGDRFSVVKYATFAPKALASINPLEPVIGSRCIIVPMQPALRTIGDLDMHDRKWPEIRSRIYLWAMQNAFDIGELRDSWQTTQRHEISTSLKDRQWELALPFVVLAEHVYGTDEAMRFVNFFEKHFEATRRAQEETDRLRLLLKCLPKLMLEKDPYEGGWYHVKDVHDVVADHLEEDAKEYYRTKQTSKHLTALGWRERKPHKGGALVKITETEVREQFKKRNVEPFEDPGHIRWLKGEIDFQDEKRIRSSETEGTQGTFDLGDRETDAKPESG